MTTLPADLVLHPLGGKSRTLDEQLKLFHLVAVVVDPYTYESSWLLDTAARILQGFAGADCRVAWIVTADEAGARSFLGELTEQALTFCDPDREFVKALGANTLPAFVHLALDRSVVGLAEGWNPDTWRPIAENLADMMSWSVPAIAVTGDPVAYAGTPAVPA
ncbi:MAG: hypothetical protein U0Q22_05920 [Acidimicrobiales bacterium]